MVRGGLTLKGHGRGRTLKGLSGRGTRAFRLSGNHRAGRRETFQGPVPAMRFQAQAHGAYHYHHGIHRQMMPCRLYNNQSYTIIAEGDWR